MARRAKPIDCDELGLTIAELAFDIARAGQSNVNLVLREINKLLPELNLTREQLVDNIVGWQQAQRKRVQTDAQKALAKLKGEAKADRTAREALDRMEKTIKGVPTEAVTPKQRREVRKALKQLMDDKRAMERQIKAKERAAKVKEKLQKGDIDAPGRVQGPKQELIAKRDELNRQLQKARNDKRRAQQIQDEIKALTEQIDRGEFETKATRPAPEKNAELERLRKIARLMQDNINLLRQLESGRIPAKKAKATQPFDDEIDKLMFQRDLLKAEMNQRIRDAQPLTFGQKMMEPFNVARATLTSMDLSALGRQGGFIAFGNPARAVRSLGVGLRALASHTPLLKRFADPNYVKKLQREMIAGEGARERERAGLHISRIEGDLSAQEEAVATHLVGRLAKRKVTIKNFPFVLAARAVEVSQEAYTIMLNKLRVDTFDAMTQALSKNGKPTIDEAKAIANYINAATGRPKFNQTLEKSADLLNTLFFAPRYALSRFQLLAGQPFWYRTLDKDAGSMKRAKRLILKEYGKYALGMFVTMYLALLGGAEIGDDPRSSDFGKAKVGNTRLDFFSGLLQPLVMMSRMVTGETVTSQGKERRAGIYPLMSFLRYKLSPLTKTLTDIAARTNAIGENTDISTAEGRRRVLMSLFVPLSSGEAIEAVEEHGIPKGTVFAIFNMLGIGTQTYDADAKK